MMLSSLPTLKSLIYGRQNGLDEFVSEWLQAYKQAASNIDLFKSELTQTLSVEQRAFFIRAFYHARGHFHDFLWFVGNHGTYEMKQLILENMAEEFGGEGRSHEEFYFECAAALGVNLMDEVVNQTTHLPFMRDYNQEHLHWLSARDAGSSIAAFAAYEKLDNPDYNNLYQLGKSLGLTGRGLIFFDVHRHVEHYEATLALLKCIWDANPSSVIEAFTFIGEHQLKMWQHLSDAVFSHSSQRALQLV